MNELKIFENDQFGKVRVIKIDEEPWFVGKDVAAALGYGQGKSLANAVANHVDAEDRGVTELMTPGGKQKVTIINESGLYSLVMSSKLPSAKAFKRWVTSEVLPSIRKHGIYITSGKISELLADPEALFQIVCNYRDERQARLKAEAENAQQKQLIAEYQPKAVFADSVAASSDTILVRELAKIICQNGVKIGQNRLFRWMRENGFLIRKSGRDYNMPTQYSLEHGLMCVSESSYIDAYGEVQLCFTPRVTAKGQQYFINKFLNKEVV